MKYRRQIEKSAAVLAILLSSFALCVPAYSQSGDTDATPSFVELYWKSSKTVVAAGITNIIVLDPEIARAEVGYESIQFFGLERGETVALGYKNGKPVSIRVRVIPRPPLVISQAFLRRQSELASGIFSSTIQVANGNGQTTLSAINGFAWSQLAGSDGRLDLVTQVEDNNQIGGHSFNLRHGSIAYQSPRMQVQAMDFLVSLTNNGPQRYLSPYSISDSVELRGGALTLKRGDNQYTFFGGTTIPFFYLTLGSTRDIGGFAFTRKQSDNLSLFSTTSYINTPTTFLGLSGKRQNDFMQTAGLTYVFKDRWTFQGLGGGSNHGGLGRAEVNYISPNLTFFAAGSTSSSLFPLNQVFSLFSGTQSIKTGLTLSARGRFTESLYYQHTITQAFNNVLRAGSSDYLTPGFAWKLNQSQDLNLTYTYSRNTGGFSSQTSTGNRVDTTWHYLFTPGFSNTAEFIVGSLQDPLQLNSQDELVFRDGVAFPIKGGTMQVAFQHDHRNPSLVQKLNSELNLLAPGLQALFLQDPVSFVQSNNLPPEVRALLDAQVPINTSISASGQFRLGNKVNLAPNFSLARASSGNSQSWTPYVGYSLTYQVSRTLQFNSSLSNIWVLNNSLSPQRTTILSFGLNKSFSALPMSLAVGRHAGRIIEGRVFRDSNLNGVFNSGERGYAGIRVDLDNGDSVETDEQGRFKFGNVGGGEHRVSISLVQFPGPVRMTTRNDVEVDLIRQRIAVINFGVVDFARLMGNVFNDLRFLDKRQPDCKGIPDVHLVLDDGRQRRTIVVESNGDYEIEDVAPGDYRLMADASTLPANYALPRESFMVHVAPVSTVVQDIPIRALRSISGRVFLKVLVDKAAPPADQDKLKFGGMPAAGARSQRGGQGGKAGQAGGQTSHTGQQAAGNQSSPEEYNLVPLAGVQLDAGYGIVKTDEKGNFLLRDLPAGDVTVKIVPARPVPSGLKVPSGAVHMPSEPIQVQNATIIISNPDLVPYLVSKTAAEVASGTVGPGNLVSPATKLDAPAAAPEPAQVRTPAKSYLPAPVVEQKHPARASTINLQLPGPAVAKVAPVQQELKGPAKPAQAETTGQLRSSAPAVRPGSPSAVKPPATPEQNDYLSGLVQLPVIN